MTSRTASPALSTTTGGGAGAGTPATRKSTGGAAANAAPTRTPTPAAKSASPVTTTTTTTPSSPALGPVRDLSKLLNLPLRIGLIGGAAASSGAGPKTVEGSLFTYDSSFVVLALLSRSPASAAAAAAATSSTSPSPAAQPTRGEESGTPKRTFTFLRTSQITSVTVLSSTPTDLSLPSASASSTSSLPPIPSSAADLSARVDRAVAEDRRARARLAPAGAAPAAQELYDALAKTLPVRWAGESIVVLDEVVIESPYEPQNVKGGKGSAERVERVKKMVEGLRTRLGMTTPAAA